MASIVTAMIGREIAAQAVKGPSTYEGPYDLEPYIPSSLPDAEVPEDHVEQLVQAHDAGDAADRAER